MAHLLFLATNLAENAAAIFLTWLLLAVILTGLGLLILGIVKAPSFNLDCVLASFWLGFAGLIALLQLWHFFFAVNRGCLAIIVVLALAGVFLSRGALLRWWRSIHWSKSEISAAVVVVIVGMWMSDWATGRCLTYDTGSYHIPAVRWDIAYPVVPGLGNLHDRLGFNSSSLLYAAMIEIGPWHGRSNHIANGLLVFMLMVQVIRAGYRLLRPSGDEVNRFVLDFLFLVSVVTVVITGNISSLSTDVAPAVVLLVAGSALYKWLTARDLLSENKDYDALLVVTLLCLAVCLKATAVIFSFAGLTVTAWLVWKGWFSATKRRTLWSATVLSAVLGITWLARGVMLSGYPLYPSRIAGFPVEWRVPSELAEAQTAWVTAFARHSVALGFGWVRPWLWAMTHGENLFPFLFWVILPLALGLAAVAAYLIGAGSYRLRRGPARGWLLAIPIVAGTVFWFLKLPDPRFGFFLFWMGAALATAQAFAALPPPSIIRFKSALVYACVLLSVLAILLEVPTGWTEPEGGLASSLFHSAFVPPRRQGGLYPIPSAQLREFTTDSGLKLYVPIGDNRCWAAPLPCTPHPAPNLILKTRFGRPEFVTNGGWQQINWPNPYSDFLQWFRENRMKRGD